MHKIKLSNSRTNIGTIGKLTKDSQSFFKRRQFLLVKPNIPNQANQIGYKDILTTDDLESLNEINTGDIGIIESNNNLHVIWNVNKQNNAIFVTERCDCRCLMCPQPPTESKGDGLYKQAKKILQLVNKNYNGEICFTGGEPCLESDYLIELVQLALTKIPKARVSILSNGKRFSDKNFAKQFSQLNEINRILICVSLHADVDIIHDKITAVQGSFKKTQLGLYNLGLMGQRVEIRIVVNKMNANRLHNIAEYLYKNYPFVSHITFMAMEITGYAVKNFDKIWIDPFNYKDELEKAVHELHRRGMNVSVYNHQLCLLNASTRLFARKSISDWKNNYLKICDKCQEIEDCCGFFTTSGSKVSEFVKPFV